MVENLFPLRNLLLNLFQPEELRMFIHLRVDANLVHALPGKEASAEVLAYGTCVALEQRGYLDARLFEPMIEERPLREAEIRRVERAFQGRPAGPQAADPVHIRNLERTLELLERCLERLEAGERSEQAWRALAMLMMGLTALLIGTHFFNDQKPADLVSDREAQDRLMAEAQAASAHAHAYLDVTSALLGR